MALPTLQDAKDYLRQTLTTDDALIAVLLARAQASIETKLGYPLTAAVATYVQFGERINWFASNDIELPGPFATSPTPVITDVNGVAIDATTYILDPRGGRIRSKYGGPIFVAAPYTVVATIGLSAHPDYAARLEAVAGMAIVDFVAHLYENRNPMLGDDLGAGINSATPAIPPRIISDLMALPCTRGLIAA